MELFILVDTSTPQQYLSSFYGRLNPASGEVTASLYYRDDFDYGFHLSPPLVKMKQIHAY